MGEDVRDERVERLRRALEAGRITRESYERMVAVLAAAPVAPSREEILRAKLRAAQEAGLRPFQALEPVNPPPPTQHRAVLEMQDPFRSWREKRRAARKGR